MLFAILSDVHSNLEALEAVLKDAGDEGAQGYLCLGDMVGYGANPHECIERLRPLQALAVGGNHDYAVCGKTDTNYFNTYARKAVHWTREHVGPEDVAFLERLPLVYHGDDFCLVHASLNRPQDWEYIFEDEDALRSFRFLKERVLFVGHSHIPWIFSFRDGRVEGSGPKSLTLDPAFQYIINVGSVGQPRDLDNRSAYGLYDSQKKAIRFRRVSYDFRQTQKKILEAKLPEILALRLEMGR